MNARSHKATASADRAGFHPLFPPSRVTPAARLPTVTIDCGFASGFSLIVRGMGFSALKQPPNVGEHSRPFLRITQSAVLESLCPTVAYVRHSPARDYQSSRLR